MTLGNPLSVEIENVEAEHNASLIQSSLPPLVPSTSQFQFGIILRNTGTTVWTNGATAFPKLHELRLQSDPCRPIVLSGNSVQIPEGLFIHPGQTHQFIVDARVENTAGTCSIQLQMQVVSSTTGSTTYGQVITLMTNIQAPGNSVGDWTLFE